MKTQPVVPARIVFDHPGREGQPFAPAYGDVYRPRDGDFDQARHVFLAGNGLPARWQGRTRFVVLETGFGLGHNFLATWLAWRQDPARCERLCFVAIDKHPPLREALRRTHATSTAPELSQALLAAWPPLTHDLHTLDFDAGRVTLLLALGEAATWLPELVARVDAFYLDGFAPARNAEMWDARVFKACARLAAPGATAATWSLARAVHQGLGAAGFAVERVPGFGGRREMSTARLNTLPRHPPAPGRRAAPAHRSALVIGSGLAGAAAADALARQGLNVTVLERRERPAQETSGNLAGLFHGVLHPQDGAHAQLLRAAALRAAQVYGPLISQGQLTGEMNGLLRGAPPHTSAASAPASASPGAPVSELHAMHALLERQGLPPDYVQALGTEHAAALAGCPVASPAWFYPAGGWLAPAELVRTWLRTEGVRLLTCADVSSLARNPNDGSWQALDAGGAVLASADLVVVAAAAQAPALLAAHGDAGCWTLRRTRGQVTVLSPERAAAHGLPRPRLPLARGGYLVSLPASLGGGLFCGATSQADDEDAALRSADHAANLAQIERLTDRGLDRAAHAPAGERCGISGPPTDAWSEEGVMHDMASGHLTGRVGWRLACDDKLPLLGPVPAHLGEEGGPAPRAGGRQGLEQPRQVPRVEGLYVFTALGSRGITLAPLLAQALAAWVTGSPMPLAASLVDAIDPARFSARRVRQAARDGGPR